MCTGGVVPIVRDSMTDSHGTQNRGASAASTSEGYDPRSGLDRYLPTLAAPIRTAGFWAAVVLPFLYVPLVLTGLSGTLETIVFLTLLCVNAFGLYVGHSHRQE